jgi:hypothetical protein
VELLIDRVLVDNGDVEIRYVIPTNPRGETTRFYQLRKDYFEVPLVPRLASRQSRSAPRRRHAQAGREAVSGGSLAPPAPAAGGWAGGGGLGLGDRQ